MNDTTTQTRAIMGGKPVFTVPSKTIINFKSGFQKKLLCDGPTFSAGTACQYSCSFCYVPDAMRKQIDWLKEHGTVGKHEDIVIRRENPIEIARRQLKNAKDKDKPLVIYASPLVDVASNMELVRETVDMCKLILSETHWHIRLLSKSNLLPKIAQALSEWDMHDRGKARVIYGVSTGTLDNKLAQAFEEGCPLVSKRIESLHWLQDNGYRTFGMICPSLPQDTQRAYEDFARDMFAAIRAHKCEHCWAEVINLRGESFTRTLKGLNDAGYERAATLLSIVTANRVEWEKYAQRTFEAHTRQPYRSGQLRFLQYVNNSNREWWGDRQSQGAVLL